MKKIIFLLLAALAVSAAAGIFTYQQIAWQPFEQVLQYQPENITHLRFTNNTHGLTENTYEPEDIREFLAWFDGVKLKKAEEMTWANENGMCFYVTLFDETGDQTAHFICGNDKIGDLVHQVWYRMDTVISDEQLTDLYKKYHIDYDTAKQREDEIERLIQQKQQESNETQE